MKLSTYENGSTTETVVNTKGDTQKRNGMTNDTEVTKSNGVMTPNGVSNGSMKQNGYQNGTVKSINESNGKTLQSPGTCGMKRDAGVTFGLSGALLTGLKLVAILPLSIVYILESCIKTVIPRRMKRRCIQGETVLITGGGSGLGRLLALRLAARGAFVIIWGRNKQNLLETCSQVRKAGGKCHQYVVDITDKEAVYSTAEDILRQYKKVDVLVNNAGVVNGNNILESRDEDIQNCFNVNVISHFHTTKAFLQPMLTQNSGQVVTVSSMAGYQGVNKMTDYCASKYAAVGYHEALSMELQANGNSGVKTTLVCPYYIDTGMFAGIRSSLIPVMSPDYVADEMMDAILMHQKYCVLPWYLAGSIGLNALLPSKFMYLVAKMLGVTEGLDDFSGSRKYQ